MPALNVAIVQQINGNLINDVDVGAVEYPLRLIESNNLKDGTGADQANMAFSDKRNILASATDTIDLSGSLNDAFGNSILFTRLKAITVTASRNNANNVQVTRPASNGVPLFLAGGDGVELTPGASMTMVFPDANGIAVTAGTGDLIDIINSAGGSSVDYTIILIGTV